MILQLLECKSFERPDNNIYLLLGAEANYESMFILKETVEEHQSKVAAQKRALKK